MKRLFHKFLWSVPIIFFSLVLIQVASHKKIDITPPPREKSPIEATGIEIKLFTANNLNTTINSQWAQVQNIPHNNNVVIICKDKVSYVEEGGHSIISDQAEIELERKDKVDYSIRKESIISVAFKESVQIRTKQELISTQEAKYLVKRDYIYGNKNLLVESSNGYLLQTAKGFKWDLKKNVITFKGTTSGEFLVN